MQRWWKLKQGPCGEVWTVVAAFILLGGVCFFLSFPPTCKGGGRYRDGAVGGLSREGREGERGESCDYSCVPAVKKNDVHVIVSCLPQQLMGCFLCQQCLLKHKPKDPGGDFIGLDSETIELWNVVPTLLADSLWEGHLIFLWKGLFYSSLFPKWRGSIELICAFS